LSRYAVHEEADLAEVAHVDAARTSVAVERHLITLALNLLGAPRQTMHELETTMSAAAQTTTPSPAPTSYVPKRSDLPLNTRFKLGSEITEEQKAFLDTNGFILFEKVASPEELQMIVSEVERIQEQWLAEKRTSVFGIPVMKGNIDGKDFVQRFAFTSMSSDKFKSFVRDDRFAPMRRLIGEDTRVGDQEKDGVVFNRYINIPGSAYPDLGWHTDGLRDIFYLRRPK
jgi:hypothetical protein